MPAVESQIAAAALPAGLTPPEARRNCTTLAGGWKFVLDPPDGFWQKDFVDDDTASDDGRRRGRFDETVMKDIAVPAHWEMEGFHSEAGVGGYRRWFVAPGGEGRLKLRFDGVYSGAKVWVNGRLVATHEGGATPFEADITDAVGKGRNLLALRVREHTPTSDHLDKMSLYADFPLTGIIRPVYLFRVPEVHVARRGKHRIRQGVP